MGRYSYWYSSSRNALFRCQKSPSFARRGRANCSTSSAISSDGALSEGGLPCQNRW